MSIYEKYSKIQKQIDALEDKKEELRDEISKELPVDGIVNEFGSFKYTNKKKWEYTPGTVGLMDQVDTLKKREEMLKIAKCTTTKVLTIKIK